MYNELGEAVAAVVCSSDEVQEKVRDSVSEMIDAREGGNAAMEGHIRGSNRRQCPFPLPSAVSRCE